MSKNDDKLRMPSTRRLSHDRPPTPSGEKRSEKRYDVICQTFAAGGSIRMACEAAGISRQTITNWRKADPEFDQRCKDAIEDGIDLLEDEAKRRAVDGVDKGIYFQGDRIATEKVYSDSLLTTMLRAHRAKYRTSAFELSGPNGGPQEHDVNVSPREILASRIAGIAERNRADGGSGGSDGQSD